MPRNGIEPPTRLKVCCIESEAEARLAVHLGASALGLVSSMPSGPGVITAEAIDPPGPGRPTAAVKELGGTGRVHDWNVSAETREAIAPVSLYLAGGLTVSNVGDAIRAVRPFCVDVCSGVRRGGRLDPDRLRRFLAAMRREDRVSGDERPPVP